MSTYQTPCYANGLPYRPLHARYSDLESPTSGFCPLVSTLDWATFWKQISTELSARHFTEGTRAQYRTILRSFYRHARRRPAETTPTLIHEYIVKLTEKHYSWSWIGMNISVLRSVFDKLAGQSLTRHFITPKRAQTLPEILSHKEIHALLAAADTTRDQLMLGLLYGCGLKVSELRYLTWSDIDSGYLQVKNASDGATRTLQIPPELVPVLDYGKARCPASDYIFQGRYGGTPLSTRMIELTIRRARQASDILKPVTAMTLRHTYAVHCIENGESIRELQQSLGHQHIKTTMRYNRCILPPNLESPLDPIKRKQRQETPQTSAPCHSPQSRNPAISQSSNPAILHPQPLFAHPLQVDALELPFSEPDSETSNRFYMLLKTLITGRFLSRRRCGTKSG